MDVPWYISTYINPPENGASTTSTYQYHHLWNPFLDRPIFGPRKMAAETAPAPWISPCGRWHLLWTRPANPRQPRRHGEEIYGENGGINNQSWGYTGYIMEYHQSDNVKPQFLVGKSTINGNVEWLVSLPEGTVFNRYVWTWGTPPVMAILIGK